MVYTFENLKEHEYNLLKASEPFFDFNYSFNESMHSWTQFHIIDNGISHYFLRMHALENLKEGLICTNFIEAKELCSTVDGSYVSEQLIKENTWLPDYVVQARKNHISLKWVALPVSEFIRHYHNNFKKLKLIDFNELFKFRVYE
jgi:hypothetical protein